MDKKEKHSGTPPGSIDVQVMFDSEQRYAFANLESLGGDYIGAEIFYSEPHEVIVRKRLGQHSYTTASYTLDYKMNAFAPSKPDFDYIPLNSLEGKILKNLVLMAEKANSTLH